MKSNTKAKNKRSFYHTKSNLDTRVRTHFISNDVAVIPLKVNGINDVISPYSVKGYESLNSIFFMQVEDIIRFIPIEYPLLLHITGYSFNDDEKRVIEKTIREDMAYELGAVEKEDSLQKKKLFYMIIGAIITGVFLTILDKSLDGIPKEFFYIVFWFFCDFLVSYLLWDQKETRKEKILAGRMASMQIMFSENFEDREITNEEKQNVYSQLNK